MKWLGVILFAVLSVAGIASPADAAPRGRVLIIGVPGLQWSDVTSEDAPNIEGLAQSGATAAMSTRAAPSDVTCAEAGWLSVSAGRRAGTAKGDGCGLPPPVIGEAAGPEWSELARWNEEHNPYRARIGLLGQAVRDAGGGVMAIGPGALLAAADRSGRVDRYSPRSAAGMASHDLIIADVPDLAVAGAAGDTSGVTRRVAVRRADRHVGDLLRRTPEGTTVLLAGVADAGVTRELHVAIAAARDGRLTSPSTRQDGLVTLLDITATALDELGIGAPPELAGRPWETRQVAADPLNAEVASQVLRSVRVEFYVVLTVVQVTFFVFAAVALRKGWHGPRVRVVTRVVAVFSATIGASTFLAQLVPWWLAGNPIAALVSATIGSALLITGAAFAGPWRRPVLGPVTVVSLVAAVATAADVMSGSRLQIDGMAGYETVTGARFHGFSNMAWAILATGTFFSLAAACQPLLDRNRRGLALLLAALVAAAGTAIIGWPGWGANFGGTVAWVAGAGIFLMLLAGLRLTAVRLALACAAGALLVGVITFVDWLRPPAQRAHLGAFAESLLSGEGAAVIGRKITSMLGNVPLSIVALAALAFFYLVLRRPYGWRVSALGRAYEAASMLRPALFGIHTSALVGFLMNDSGIAIPAMMLTMALPLIVAVSVHAPASGFGDPRQARFGDPARRGSATPARRGSATPARLDSFDP